MQTKIIEKQLALFCWISVDSKSLILFFSQKKARTTHNSETSYSWNNCSDYKSRYIASVQQTDGVEGQGKL